MKLRKRQKRKTAQALDAAAGITKIWSEWQIGKRATKGAAKGAAKVKKSGLKDKLTSKPARFAGLAALVGGAGAAVAKKLKGGGREPIYTPPAGGEPVAPPDVSPPLTIAPEPVTPTDATMPQGTREAAVGASGLADGDAAATAEPEAAETAAETAEPAAPEAAAPDADGSARPSPTAGDVEPAVPTDDPLPEPSNLDAEPEPIADDRGGDPPAVEAKAGADDD
ncbi:MAG: hypothetical protein QOJ89_2944 [bacterium]